MLFELIQISDPIVFEADSPAVAGMVGLAVGSGNAGVRDEQGEVVLPIMLFGGDKDLIAWTKSVGIEGGVDGMSLYLDAHRAEIVAALRSMVVCSMSDRKALRSAVGDDPEALVRWNEAKRSSLSDFCGYARDLADRLEAAGKQV